MRNFLVLWVLASSLVVPPSGFAEEESPPGSITFVAKNVVATAHGTFHRWKITEAVIVEAKPEESRIELEIDLASIDTDDQKRDDHLRNPDFFDVAKFPKASVLITSPRLDGEDAFVADVTLDLHGVSKTFPIRFSIDDREQRKISASFTLNRMDFGIGEPHTGLNPLSIEEEIPMKVVVTVPAGS